MGEHSSKIPNNSQHTQSPEKGERRGKGGRETKSEKGVRIGLHAERLY